MGPKFLTMPARFSGFTFSTVAAQIVKKNMKQFTSPRSEYLTGTFSSAVIGLIALILGMGQLSALISGR